MTTPTTLILFGGSGDLSSRLLLPALGQLLTDRADIRVQLIGVGADSLSDDEWSDRVRSSFDTTDSSGEAVDALLRETTYIEADVTDADALSDVLSKAEGAPAVYFALPPHVTEKACVALESVDLPEGTVLGMEKPFGNDAESAHRLNQQLLRLVPEEQVHRVDHFLGQSTVLNLLGLRFANRVFEPLWNRDHIDSVGIVYDEQLGLEGRADYYDSAGALVDMIQSHLLQVMSIFAMEPPHSTDAVDLRDAKSTVLRATRVCDGDPVASSHRARYTEGTVGDRHFPSYVDEPNVDPSRKTETLAQVTFEIDNWRWAGVPFTLRSGKAIGTRRREIIVRFKPAPHVPGGLSGSSDADVLRIALGPDGMALEMNVNGPGDPWELDRVELSAEFGAGQLKAYGEVLESMLNGDPSLSVRGDAAEQMWRIVAPVIQAWRNGEVPLDEYATGSEGPEDWPKV
ncbi:glucose-6-phosphate dehydrogenase [Paramicrobacterium agarici]|uniref:glucose-6-phosphate dehydrogenase n=1 Tax=Paramicrobacterium agarici TaxID=630514 RepID=UPI0011537376|nr:glucose-6-phosphate dehydrogenase [Microbacterium agarici]TQO21505.1 glucose-6-phosphate 1-dehydrogenase [Microbacterium agarici]